MPNVPGLTAANPMTHIEALDLDRLPRHLIVIGGGYIGLELAQAVRRFGSDVTVIEQGAQLAEREDPDVGAALLDLFHDEGIEALLGTHVSRVEGLSGKEVRVYAKDGPGERVIEGTDLLVSVGRTPNTKGIGLEQAGVELDERGYIKVNDRLETTASNVWAMGDCAGSPQFTHVAYHDFRVVRDNLKGGNRTTKDRVVPFCMFTDPELARVGRNETEAKRDRIEYRIAKLPMANVLRTETIAEPRGFMKMLIGKDSDQIVGFTAFGIEASELMAAVQTAMVGRLPYTVLRDAIFAHPTMSEGLNQLLANVPARSNQRQGDKIMSSISIGVVRVRTTVKQVVVIEDLGKEIVRWGLVVVLAWIGGMKFTAYEAMGIQPLVAHSPIIGWMYDFLSVRSFSTMLGFIEIGTAVLISLRSVSPKASAIGSVLAMGLFATTLSFLISTPGWEPTLGFPALSAMPGQFLLKDIVLFGAAVWSLGESLEAIVA